MALFHISCCSCCLPHLAVQTTCYFSAMLRCIEYGWHIPCSYNSIVPLYRVSGNYPAVALYADHVSKEIAKMCATKVLYPVHPSSVRFHTPINAVIKNSDKNRARTIANIHITDQESLTRASDILVAAGLSKIKIRVTTDHTATGLNSCSYSPAFSYPTIADALRHVKQDCFMCVADIERYFHSYPTAQDDRTNFCIQYGGVSWMYSKCCFGHTACPYYTSTFGAEYHRWFTNIYGIPNSYIVDDWFTAALTLSLCLSQMQTICNVFEICGFTMNASKFKYGQQVVFLGILIDSVTMTVRFDPIAAKSFRIELQLHLNVLLANKHLDFHCIRPICGKLNWFAELVQSGRLHITSCWNYLRFYRSSYPASMNQLRQDFQWWIALLLEWERDTSSPLVYRILSADTLSRDPASVYVVQSDASGTDGYGYYHSYLNSKDLQYVSKRWDGSLDYPDNSMWFELRSLSDFLEETTISDCMLVWLNDNEASTHVVNKGNCKDPASRLLLSSILTRCDQLHLQIIAIWVPRESNQFADYLSHLSTYLHRSSVYGTVAAASPTTGGEDSHEVEQSIHN